MDRLYDHLEPGTDFIRAHRHKMVSVQPDRKRPAACCLHFGRATRSGWKKTPVDRSLGGRKGGKKSTRATGFFVALVSAALLSRSLGIYTHEGVFMVRRAEWCIAALLLSLAQINGTCSDRSSSRLIDMYGTWL